MTKKSPTCYIVVPCFNEQAVLPVSAAQFANKLNQLIHAKSVAPDSKIVFVDDGSQDKTWQLITDLHRQNPVYCGLKLAHNRGHQNALLAGLLYAADKAEIVTSFDADLQDDINVLDDFIAKYQQGAQIVYGIRNDRNSDSFFKKHSAQLFYKLMGLLGIQLLYNHADCRLMSRQALQALAQYPEQNLFLRGIIPTLGFKTDRAFYARTQRAAGESKYPFKKMLALAWEGITSFSLAPIRLLSVIGVGIAAISLGIFSFFLLGALWHGAPVPGWASLICSIWFIGGVQLLALSIIGEYIGKTYLETKRRPRYIIEQELYQPGEQHD